MARPITYDDNGEFMQPKGLKRRAGGSAKHKNQQTDWADKKVSRQPELHCSCER